MQMNERVDRFWNEDGSGFLEEIPEIGKGEACIPRAMAEDAGVKIDDSITCSPDDPRSSLSFDDFVKNNSNAFTRNNSRAKTNLNLFKYNKGMFKMRAIDNYNIEKKNMFYYDSANSCRDKYRKKVFDD